jgi:hypothetical protein
MSTVHNPKNSNTREMSRCEDPGEGMERITLHEETLPNEGRISQAAITHERLPGADRSAMRKNTDGLGEMGKMEAKLVELRLKKKELAGLQAKVDEDIKTLRDAMGLLDA